MTSQRVDGLYATRLDLSIISSAPAGTLYLSSCPGHCKESGTSPERQQAHLDWLKAEGVDFILALTPDEELERLGLAAMPAALEAAGIERMLAAVVDRSTPDAAALEVFMAALARLKSVLDGGGTALVHCQGGFGRTGTAVGVLLIQYGVTADAAINHIRSARPGCIETDKQEAFVRSFAG